MSASNAFTAAAARSVDVESNIWRFADGANSDGTRLLVSSWVNTNGTVPTTQIAYIPNSNAFVVVGDLEAFRTTFGDAWVAVSSSYSFSLTLVSLRLDGR